MNRFIRSILILSLIGVVFVSGYTYFMLNWSYAEGERAGYVQKFSKRGWLCKTWEGELAMVSMPGTMSEKFFFSVREDAVAPEGNCRKPVSLIVRFFKVAIVCLSYVVLYLTITIPAEPFPLLKLSG